MRVLFVTHSYPRHAGDVAGAFIQRLAIALRDAGTEVLVLAPSAPGLARRDEIGGVPVQRYRYAPESWETLAYDGTMVEQVRGSWRGKLALAGMLLGIRRGVRAAMRDFRPDLIHAHWWFPSALAMQGMAGRPPLVVTMHGSDVRLAAKSAPAQAAYRMVANRAAAMAAVSGWLADTARSFAGRTSVRIAPMPVDTALFPFAEGSRSGRVLFVGRLNAQKGVADLVEALVLADPDIQADIVGDGPDRDSLDRLAAARGVAHRITWHGALPQERIAPLYRAASAVVIPSREEGLGLVAVEAQLSGTPVVAYRSGGLPDVVDVELGRLVSVGDIAGLAEAMTSVGSAAGSTSRAAAAREARARMLARFSPEAAAAAYTALYSEASAR